MYRIKETQVISGLLQWLRGNIYNFRPFLLVGGSSVISTPTLTCSLPLKTKKLWSTQILLSTHIGQGPISLVDGSYTGINIIEKRCPKVFSASFQL